MGIKSPDYQSLVALVLALTVAVVLLRYVWVGPQEDANIEMVRMLKELLLVIVGVLAGYVTRGKSDD
jgi:hypothetical protein